MKKLLVYFIFLVMVAGLFSCVSSTKEKSIKIPELKSKKVVVGEIDHENIFINLGISPDRWKLDHKFLGGYSRGAFKNKFIAYTFDDRKRFVHFNILISKTSNFTEGMIDERFMELVQKELDWFYQKFEVKKQTSITPLMDVEVGKVPALFTSIESYLNDGRHCQISFAGMVYEGREIFMIFHNEYVDYRKNNHLHEVLKERIPQIVFQARPFENIS